MMKNIPNKISLKMESAINKSTLFTLIELLAVISLIAILTSMLLPALRHARESAQKISCVNNLKQLGTAVQMYATDFEGYFPSAQGNIDNPGVNIINTLVVSVFNAKRKDGFPKAWELDGTATLDFLLCPTADSANIYINNYGWNIYCASFPEIPLHSKHQKMVSIPNPSVMILIGDASADTGSVRINYWDYYDNSGWPRHINYRHANSTNLLRADMHVDSTKENIIGKREWLRQD